MTIYSEIVKSIQRIPPLSQSAFTLLEGMETQTMGMKQIAEIVVQDPALTINILKMVNAPAFGLGKSIPSVSRAVSFLGLKMVVALALATCSPAIYGVPLPGYEAERGELWLHALYTAMASREIVKYSKYPISSELAFTAGILHDIGKAVLSEVLSGCNISHEEFSNEIKEQGFRTIEQFQAGGDHCEAGYALAKHWNLPEPLIQAIRFHHTPQHAAPEWRSLVYTVHIADILAMMEGVGTGIDCLNHPLDTSYSELFVLSEKALEEIIIELNDQFKRLKTPIFV
ncbi:HDOD domain-containing protein [Desulfovibrio inopinatus]|uniref:HDOD domain-containing protein n=1 Tax=Desulfovibrio inopinatus TaxID=102109 RepID=UPI000557ABA9|nr:HDOD domain-containing protein [Desulfovibrio inopinatus]